MQRHSHYRVDNHQECDHLIQKLSYEVIKSFSTKTDASESSIVTEFCSVYLLMRESNNFWGKNGSGRLLCV